MSELNGVSCAEICMQPGDSLSSHSRSMIAAAYENVEVFERGLASETPRRANQGAVGQVDRPPMNGKHLRQPKATPLAGSPRG